MPRQWKALPKPGDDRVLMKAPDYKTFMDQEDLGPTYRFLRDTTKQTEQAVAMLDALQGELAEIPQGQEFVVYRYPQGLGCRLPSGWTVMIPIDHRKHPDKAGKWTKPKGEPQEVAAPKAPRKAKV
jgi:hypothetical protein